MTLDPSTGERNLRLRPQAGLGLRAFAAHGRDLWVLASRTGQLVHLDARSGRRIGDPVPLPGTASAVAATADAVYVAVTQPELDPGDQILVIDPGTGETRQSIDVPRDGVRRLVLARGRLWLLASNPAEVIGLDPSDPARPRHVRLNADHATDLAVGAGYLWATLSDADKLSRISFDGELADFPTGRGPSGIAVRKGVVWVANRTDSTLMPIDVRTGERGREEDPDQAESVRRRGVRRRDLGDHARPGPDRPRHRSRRLTTPVRSACSARLARFWFCGRSSTPKALNSARRLLLTASTLTTSSSAICWLVAGVE